MTVQAKETAKNQPLLSRPWFWVLLPTTIAFVLYLSTMQLHINGSNHPFATDVGEIQNALPRWGTIHHSSYPLYSAAGSLFITLFRFVGLQPAAGASLFSAVFGALTIGLVVILALEVGIAAVPAAVGTLVTAVATSIWVDASIAEVHTVTLAFSAATLLFAARFGRTGKRKDLLLLTLIFTQAVAHQRSVILLAPSVLIFIWPNWRQIWPHKWAVLLITLLAPLTYLYLPLRAWMGADWIFGAPGTWDGFWTLFFDNRAGRVFEIESSLIGWWVRASTALKILSDDLPWALLLTGFISLLGMTVNKTFRRAGSAFLFVWLINFFLTMLIWEHTISDALLAAKLPVLIMTGLGLAYLLHWLKQQTLKLSQLVTILILLIISIWAGQTRNFTLSITRDRSIEQVIEIVDRVKPFTDGRRTTISIPWGRDFWGLTYAQAYRGQLQGLNLVDHNANPRELLANGDHLLTPLATFLVFPVPWWEQTIKHPLYLSTAAPGVVEMSPNPLYASEDVPLTVNKDLQNGVRIRNVDLEHLNNSQIKLTVYWESIDLIAEEYSVAVHLVTQDPPQTSEDILAQADNKHPVDGYYPTTHWQIGEIVRDDYLIEIPPDSDPQAVRLGMYRKDPDQGFINTPWYSIQLAK